MATSTLPQMGDRLFITDGGIETTLIFKEGFDLPYFAAFDLLKHEVGKGALRKYFDTYAGIARRHQVGLVLESATWRASPDWASKIGYSDDQLASANREAVQMLRDVRAAQSSADAPMVISGCLGPRGDGYNPDSFMSAEEAERYHGVQATQLRDAGVDMLTAITMTYPNEAIGITRVAQQLKLPVVISFTVETDGRLPNGQSLREAIEAVDAATGNGPAYYMINCAHPNHLKDALADGGAWRDRIGGLRANASTKSHAELDQATELDDGDPQELGRQYVELRKALPRLNVLGGCCGTDDRHVEAICVANLAAGRAR